MLGERFCRLKELFETPIKACYRLFASSTEHAAPEKPDGLLDRGQILGPAGHHQR